MIVRPAERALLRSAKQVTCAARGGGKLGQQSFGEVAEWLIALVSKTSVR